MSKHIQPIVNSIFATLKAYHLDLLEVMSHPKAEGRPI